MADVFDHPLLLREPRRACDPPGVTSDLLDLLTLWHRESRWPPTGVLRIERVEAVRVEVVDHLADSVLEGGGHSGDLAHIHSPGRTAESSANAAM